MIHKFVLMFACLWLMAVTPACADAFPLGYSSYQGTMLSYDYYATRLIPNTFDIEKITFAECNENCGTAVLDVFTQENYQTYTNYVSASIGGSNMVGNSYSTGCCGGDDSLGLTMSTYDHFIDGIYVNDVFYQSAEFIATFDLNPSGAVPEVTTWAMMLIGFAGLSLTWGRRQWATLA